MGKTGLERGETPLVSVVLATYNRRDDLREALRSVMAQDYPRVEVLVVDNASGDGTAAMVREEFPGARLVALDENRGMDGYSEGFRRARGEIVFQMDNDSLLPGEEVLSAVVERFVKGPPELAVVSARVEEYVPGSDDIEDLRRRDGRRGPLCTGGFHSGGVAFRRGALDRVGGYNRDVFLYGAELFLQMKILAEGLAIAHYPEILVLHTSSGAARSPEGLFYEIRNRLWALRCFTGPGRRLRLLPLVLLHDFLYAARQGKLGPFARALGSGLLRPLPESLLPPLRSAEEGFNRKLDEIERSFGLRATLAKTRTRKNVTTRVERR